MVMIGKGATDLLLPSGEKVGMRGAKPQASRDAFASLTLTPLAFGESPSPLKGEGR